MSTLTNDGLREIHTLLVPSKELPTAKQENEDNIKESSVSSHSEADITTSPAEFIPSIFFSLHKIRKDPNNVTNQLETSTGFIRHRIKRCKTLISENEEVRSLLSHSTDTWNTIIADREQELRVKDKVLQDLDSQIENILKQSTEDDKN